MEVNALTTHNNNIVSVQPLAHIYQSVFIGMRTQRDMFEHVFLMIITQGHGVHEVDYVRYQLKVGDIMIILPGQAQTFSENSDLDGYLIVYTKGALSSMSKSALIKNFHIYDRVLKNPLFTSDTLTINTIKKMCESLNQVIANPLLQPYPHIATIQLQTIVHTIGLLPNRTYKSGPTEKGLLFLEFKTLMHANLTVIRSTREYAAMMTITSKQLNDVVKDAIGLTAKELINEKLMIQIKQRLIIGESSIEEIASTLGFQNPSYLSRFFKKHTGITPLRYKKFRNSI